MRVWLKQNQEEGAMQSLEPYSEADREEEERRLRWLRRLVDFSLAFIAQTDLSLEDAERVVGGVRNQAYALFPDKKETFELIYTPRFRRLIAEKFACSRLPLECQTPCTHLGFQTTNYCRARSHFVYFVLTRERREALFAKVLIGEESFAPFRRSSCKSAIPR